ASVGAGRGVIYTAKSFGRYRIVFDIRHVSGNPDHQACVLVFCTAPTPGVKPPDALGGIQFQVPTGGHWDYRKGHNNGGNDEFTKLDHPKFKANEWSRCEILVDPATGTARMAVAQPVGSKAVEALDFKDPTAGQKGPFALQMHNRGLFDEYANIAIEEEPVSDELITTK
ncbi:MAG TPA: family 16 glycoside hydrolase, partial [Tepidisphaeraceae bacterium]|nr:family 16 glycoside hydrolase [Tepidisphaeraceae bacterium]